MKVLHLNTSDIKGGAARAAYRLHQGLQNININSQMLVQEKYSNDKTIFAPRTRLSQGIAKARITFDALPLKLYKRNNKSLFSLQWLPDTVISKINQIHPDIINLHWINAAFIQIETIGKLKQPLVWTLHDMWPFTGGCHVTGECDRYTVNCGNCPHFTGTTQKDLSYWMWQRKAKAWKKTNLTLVSPSSWLASCAQSSPLFKNFRIEIIPHGLDHKVYRPIPKQTSRELLNLPLDKQLIIFGAVDAIVDTNKGFHLLQLSLKKLSNSNLKERIEIVIFGASQPENPPDLGFKCHYLGHLNDNLSLTIAYSSADVMIVPSYQESFGQTASESMACGTPVVAFNATGLKDIVDHQQNGYLAKAYEVEDLAQGIAWVLEDEERYQKLSYYSRYKVERNFTLEMQANRYLNLFHGIIQSMT